MKATVTAFALSFLFLTACEREEQQPQVVVFSANGDINPELNRFRTRLGNLNTMPGQTIGRREINWDGVPEELTGVALPNDVFNATLAGAAPERKRGLIYGGPATPMVSKTAFEEVNPLSASEFQSFSGDKAFAIVDATEWPVEFRVAGENTIAAVQGFGAVFADVDEPQSTFIECFDGNTSLGKHYVKAQSGGSKFSFLGVFYPGRK